MPVNVTGSTSPVHFKITRLAPGLPHYIMTIRAEDFSLEWMRDALGGGDYYVRAFDGRQYVQSFRLYMDPNSQLARARLDGEAPNCPAVSRTALGRPK